MDKINQRQTVKGFGQLINDNFYIGKENLFPFNRFYGYHAGIDLEALPDEQVKNVPIFAVTEGTISYIGSLSGYGGVILERLDSDNHTALYGHVKIKNLPYKIGDHLSAGQILTYLGDEFSNETSKERKHLHFALYRGTDLYFKGHENDLNQLKSRWEDPTEFLKGNGVNSPGIYATPSPKPISTPSTNPLVNPPGIFYNIIKILLQIFGIKI